MDKERYMVVDTAEDCRKKYLTEDIAYVSELSPYLLEVRFNNGKVFRYGTTRLKYLKNPTLVDIEGKGVYYKRRKLENVSRILRYSNGKETYYHIIYNKVYSHGVYPEYCEEHELHVSRFSIEKDSGTLWEFIHKVILETGPMNDDGKVATEFAFKRVDTDRDDVPLAQYLGFKDTFKKHRLPKTIIYPFGCNASQKAAVEKALANQLSVIEGPPGTGKTQTILNIIANLIIQNKNVLISSFNNSAVLNVSEKLKKEGMDFIVAKIGSSEDKEKFFSSQQGYTYSDDWLISDVENEYGKVKSSLESLTRAFLAKEAEMKSTQILYDNNLEIQHGGIDDNYDTVPSFLKRLPSEKIMYRLEEYKIELENGRKTDILSRIIRIFKLGYKLERFMNGSNSTEIIKEMERAFYLNRTIEYKNIQKEAIQTLSTLDSDKEMKILRESSMKILKYHLAKRFQGRMFRMEYKSTYDINNNIDDFLYDFPVILSTTSSARNCIDKNMVFDYIIMDESSQIDIATGAVALSTANNAVIVGDDKQLPNVVSKQTIDAVTPLLQEYSIDEKYNSLSMNFLRSILAVFPNLPRTLLREHYRCHPLIIGFCNKMFYGGELICMTYDHGEEGVLRVFRTVPGNHARDKYNQREIDVIKQEAMPLYQDTKDIGIVTPYNAQGNAINRELGMDIASTVHKFQGRECDTIIMSAVDNNITRFSNDPNLINVAISRAKNRFCLVITGNDIPESSYLHQFIKYTEYNYMEIKNSRLRSVMDSLYRQRNIQKELLEYNKNREKKASSDTQKDQNFAEEIFFSLIKSCMAECQGINLDFHTHYTLAHIISDTSSLTEEEADYAMNPLTHIDCLIYNTVTLLPLLAIEFDGWTYHQNSEIQTRRDRVKDSILDKIGLKLVRISSTEIITKEKITQILKTICA